MSNRKDPVKEGLVLRQLTVRPSEKRPGDGIGWYEGMAIIVKDVHLPPGKFELMNLVILNVKERYAFAKVI